MKTAGKWARRGFYVAAALSLANGVAGMVGTYQQMREYLTLPPEFYLDVDLDRTRWVWRAPDSHAPCVYRGAGRGERPPWQARAGRLPRVCAPRRGPGA